MVPDMKQSLRFWFFGLFWMGLAFLAGCENQKSENEKGESVGKPYAGQRIDMAVPAERNLATDWQLPMSEWSVQHGAECLLHEYVLPKDAVDFPAVLKTAPRETESPEVMFIPWSAVPELIAQDALAEIPQAIRQPEQLDWLGFFPGLRNRVAEVARKPRLVPVSCPVLVCYYRQDLLEKAGLSAPKTWADYQTLLETLADWAPGMSAVEPWGEPFRATMFLARSAAGAKHPEQFSFCFSLSSGEPIIDNPGFISSLKQAKAALARMPGEVKNYSPGDCRKEILSGRAALAIAYETELDQKLKRGENLQIGISQLPGSTRVYNTAIDQWVEFDKDTPHRVTLTGFAGWAFGVSNNLEPIANNAAWELVRYMTLDQLPAGYSASLVSPCRDSQTGTPADWTGSELTTSESLQYVSVVADALRSDQLVMEFPLIGHTQFRAALTQGLTKAISQNGNEEAALKEVAKKWREIIGELGKEKVAKSYQRSHD